LAGTKFCIRVRKKKAGGFKRLWARGAVIPPLAGGFFFPMAVKHRLAGKAKKRRVALGGFDPPW